MSYTALEQMRQRNWRRFGKDVGPFQPEMPEEWMRNNDLKSAALRFLHERCEGLKFDASIEQEENKTGILRGNSLLEGQIPYNMQMDVNRLCLEKALERFIDSGVAEDAYDVYYCYFVIFFGSFGKSKRMVELLSEFESNGSSLLMKHRDHYSHSVYVFALGLAVYETSSRFAGEFKTFYELTDEREAANLFLAYWGLASLFHDIGYPFELPFEQVLSYFEVDKKKRGKGCLYIAYHDINVLTELGEEARERFQSLYGRSFGSVVDLLAFDITDKLGNKYGFDEETMREVLENKPVAPNEFGYYMDHAFFSACRLYRELESVFGATGILKMHVDALSAIMLHNSLFKFSISFYKDKEKRKAPLAMSDHPLAYLLMLCDELQCWDRTAYGRNSRTELHPMAAEFAFEPGRIHACYIYDAQERDKITEYEKKLASWEAGGRQGDEPKLKAYSDMKGQGFQEDIEKIVDTKEIALQVSTKTKDRDFRNKHVYLSSSNFLHLFDFAVALHGRRHPGASTAFLEEEYEKLSLEYQLSTLNRAKNFSRYLDAINCFYTDKPVDYEIVTGFNDKQTAVFAPMEHERWIREHQAMGWKYGTDYETVELEGDIAKDEKAYRKMLREQMRRHKLTMDGPVTSEDIKRHFLGLDEKDQDKDKEPFDNLLKLLKQFDGLRIYRIDR